MTTDTTSTRLPSGSSTIADTIKGLRAQPGKRRSFSTGPGSDNTVTLRSLNGREAFCGESFEAGTVAVEAYLMPSVARFAIDENGAVILLGGSIDTPDMLALFNRLAVAALESGPDAPAAWRRARELGLLAA